MKYRNFRDFKIVRTCTKQYSSHGSYKPHLKKDFQNRCAYCNILDNMITTSFEVDHFIPEDVFKDVKDELATAYQNLIYSCKKCNRAKSNLFEGDITCQKPTNAKFYDPVKVDYNDIFYRTEFGSIASDNIKGRNMIKDLELYKPIHSLAWTCEEMKKLIAKLEELVSTEMESTHKDLRYQALYKLKDLYIEIYHTFISNYNNKKFIFENPEIVLEMDKLL